MSYKKSEWAVCVGFIGEQLKEVEPVVENLKKKYPSQTFRVYNSKFPQYTFLLVTFAKDRDSAHKIGLALVRKHLPKHLNLLYWCKEIKSLKDIVKGERRIGLDENSTTEEQ